MKPLNFLSAILLATSLLSCGEEKNEEKNHFSIELNSENNKFKPNDELKVSLKNPDQKQIAATNYYIGDTPITLTNGSYTLTDIPYGKQTLKAVVSYGESSETVTKQIEVLAATAPKIYSYTIVNTYPHDIKAYTQGLEFHKDTLYESTGLRGQSSLRKVDFKTGEVLKKIALDNKIFGEGLTILNDKIYQLTWQSMIGYVYNLTTFEKEKTFSYVDSKQGWGLCNDGEHIYKSDGSERIYTLDKETLAEQGFIQLVTNKSVYEKANELEYVDGTIYANAYQKDGIMIIDAETGIITGVIDCRGLKEKVTQHQQLDVLNGIAYNPKTKTFFITGKNWDKMFEVTFSEK
ncbi:glutaminyl-peptide cyclotransferase [Neptunitalea lumnitzerae]|uniref:Glutamine cyclotransferase n=1 Tax=Neptunitalea lumnitzerae TaxID=2965509 RepID=A0ABQ5MIP1_9FLAO|nr:glutaminyl-peptide cyclotransferase [Neptunitalea sp. Y10]GLB49222.1 glutamine cyclotransferase [Neptunitalea sp. Y10]